MADTKNLQQQLFEEIKSRIKLDDVSAPVKMDDYWYYARSETKEEYPIYCRKYQSLENDEEIILDENKLAAEHEFFSLGTFEVSPDHQLLAYSVNTDGSDRYTLYIKNLATGDLLREVIENTRGSFVWFNDNYRFLYTIGNQQQRPFKVLHHKLGTDPQTDQLVWHETDERFFVGLYKSRDEKYLFIEIGSHTTTEVHYLKASETNLAPACFTKLEAGHEYSVSHHQDTFFILSNHQAPNFKLMQTPAAATARENWQEIIPHREGVSLDSMMVFKDFLVLEEMTAGLTRLRIRNFQTGEEHYVEFDEPVYSAGISSNPNFDTPVLRFAYSSPVTPTCIYDYHMETKERTLIKQEEVLGGYDANEFVTGRIYATATDGTQIPISLSYRKGTELDGTNPLWLSGYGAYGTVPYTGFIKNRISLLKRGFVYATAHIRGGGENGQGWHDGGRYFNKRNTFTDFIACAEALIAAGYTSQSKLLISGGSAAGLLIGAVLNERPGICQAAIATVPFVDVLSTMLDTTLPLTQIEYEEWGDPNDKTYYDYILSYSPYDNVKPQTYPHLFIEAGINDSRVPYWEPAKWTAKLRDMKTDDNLLILKTNLGFGHGGASGRSNSLREIAFDYAFALKALGLTD